MAGGVVVLRLHRARQRRQRGRERALQIAHQLRAVDGHAEARGDRLDEHRVGLGQRAGLGGLDVQHAPHRPVDQHGDGQLRAGVGGGIAHDVVGVHARVRHERGVARAGDLAVDALRRRLLGQQELGHHLRQRAARGDQPQHAVLVEPLDRREIEGECLVQLVDDQLGHLLDVALGRQLRRQARGQAQLLAQVGHLAGSGEALDARVGAMAAQRLGATLALLGAGTLGGLDSQLGHDRAHIGRKMRILEPRIIRLDIVRHLRCPSGILRIRLDVTVPGAEGGHPPPPVGSRARAPGRARAGERSA